MKWLLLVLTAAAVITALLGYDPVGQMLEANKDCRLPVFLVLAIVTALFFLAESGKKQPEQTAGDEVDHLDV